MDAIANALGAVLLQGVKPVRYGSRALSQSEAKWSSYGQKVFAAVWAVEYFNPFISDKPLKLHTDCQSLKFIMESDKVLGKEARWHAIYDIISSFPAALDGPGNASISWRSRLGTGTLNKPEMLEFESLRNLAP